MNRKDKIIGATLLTLFFSATVVWAQVEESQGEVTDGNPWKVGLGVGPNLTRFDVVADELDSSIGAAVWVSRKMTHNMRLDLSFDHFAFSGAGRSYSGGSAAYGFEFLRNTPTKFFVMLGLGSGAANNFPKTINTHQTPPHFFARVGMDELLRYKKWSMGIIFDYFYVDLDDKPATQAQLGLPLLSFTYNFGDNNHSRAKIKSMPPTNPAAEPLPTATAGVAIDDPPMTVFNPIAAQPKASQEPAPPTADSDNDGVDDFHDECPNTPAGTKVNSIGCSGHIKVRKILRLQFDTGRYKIEAKYLKAIDQFARFLRENSDLTVVIEGHTDNVGTREFNAKLSRWRAESVRRALIVRGKLKPERVRAAGYGFDRPEKANDTNEGRRINRRVIATLSTSPSP